MDVRQKETQARFIPTMTIRDFAIAILGEDAERYVETKKRIMVEDRRLDVDLADYNTLIRHIKPESIKSGTVKITNADTFAWTRAKARIMNDFGLSNIKYLGTKKSVHGFIIRSIINSQNGEEQLQKYTAFVRRLKSNLHNIEIIPENCNDISETMNPCDVQPFFEDRRKEKKRIG